ncbi:hypothetical protein [Ornithinibacillus bavariensis]|uniref:Uncharacterized protein n=1 Tax=Ornithinibacillus bavariensis TaxID=545502 RepID=A0A919XBB3_9BACI|nr:hypothetical protein [Ornithinibacillus bavariensis]GIO27530.1 hypothetical protein J43TS3_21410 [Ornithinibacillus bavariensis]HAM80201.1 hypothetical protein [Ornithinibacillus sp.]
MRVFIVLTAIAATITMIYKWRYKLMNAMLAVSFLRRIAVSLTMRMPSIRKDILPSMFKEETTTQS